MTSCKRILLGLAMSGTALLAVPAHALPITITFGGQTATDGSGLTSNFVPASNTGLSAGYFIETYDPATNQGYPGGLAAPGNASISVAAGCSVNSYSGINITPGGGGFSVQNGSTPGAAAPAGDTTCFGFGPKIGGSLPASVMVDYSPLLALTPGVKISYLGLYYGSIDTYNDINLYDSGALIGTITGSSVLLAASGISGNQTQPGSNVYVNFFFDPSQAFTAFEFVTTGVAFEVDNIVAGLDNRVPEPGSLALLSAGLLGLAALRRKQRKS